MVPETTTRDEAQAATKTDDVIKAFARDEDFTRLNHPVNATIEGVPVCAIFSLDYNIASIKVIVTDDAEVIETDTHDSHCSHCEANSKYIPDRGTPSETRAKERRRANCRHANVASQAKYIGSDDDHACPNCGHYAVEVRVTPITRRTPHGDRVHVSDVEERRCGHCAHHR